jgi:trans-aconitate methyltransferase
LTKKNATFEWSDECQRAFKTLCDALISAPVLAVAGPSKSHIVDTNANDGTLSAVVMQDDTDGNLHRIAFASKKLTTAQQNYDTTKREALAIPWSLGISSPYLLIIGP